MNSLLKKVLTSAAGLVLVLAFWTVEGKIFGSGSTTTTVEKIPSKVWEGGGTTLTIETDSSDPAILTAFFESTTKTNGTPVRSLDTYEKIAAGHHTFTVDVPDAVGGNLELKAQSPKPGSRLTWTVRAGDRVVKDETDTLNEPLRANEAFFVTADVVDFSRPEAEE